MADPILPAADAIVSKAIDAIVALRPEALAHFNAGGNWATLPSGWRAQMLLNLARLADEAKSARLRGNTGAPLRALCASEFQTALSPNAQKAVGQVLVQRPPPGIGHAPAGAIRKGDLFVKQAQPSGIALPDPNAYPLPIASATYEAIQAVYLAQDQLNATILLRATTPGIDGNIPIFLNVGYSNGGLIQPAKPLFDTTLFCYGDNAAGGSSPISDGALIAAARAFAIGQFGPTDGAIVAGILRQQAVRRYAAFTANGTVPYAQIYIADESWGTSVYWISTVTQAFADQWQGFGCRVYIGYVFNLQIAIAPTIILTSTDYLNNTDDIDQNVRAAVRAYFDDRPDWYRWHANSLQAVISNCDPRIQQCTGVVVTDVATGATVAEPSNSFGLTAQLFITHYYLADNNVSASYAPPT
jgi:hypothetical protein